MQYKLNEQKGDAGSGIAISLKWMLEQMSHYRSMVVQDEPPIRCKSQKNESQDGTWSGHRKDEMQCYSRVWTWWAEWFRPRCGIELHFWPQSCGRALELQTAYYRLYSSQTLSSVGSCRSCSLWLGWVGPGEGKLVLGFAVACSRRVAEDAYGDGLRWLAALGCARGFADGIALYEKLQLCNVLGGLSCVLPYAFEQGNSMYFLEGGIAVCDL